MIRDAPMVVGKFWKRMSWPQRVACLLVVLTAAAVSIYVAQRITDRWKTNVVDRKDTKLEKSVDTDLKSAEVHGTNANTASVRRQDLEAEHKRTQDELKELQKESARTAERLSAARKQYEKILRSNPADYDPALSDDELCAELQRFDPPIPCR